MVHIRNLFFLLTILSSPLTIAQSGQILGKVFDTNKQALEFVNISLQGTDLGTTSNTQGFFNIKDIPFGEYEVLVSIIGYEVQTRKVLLHQNSPVLNLTFKLVESASSLDEIVVSGTMLEVSKLDSPVPVEVYSSAFFRANPNPSIFESLQNINGVRPQLNCNICNTGDIHINGLEGPYTMVLIDGMPIVSGLSTVYGLTGIPQSLIERVEIVKGSASTLYGSEAVAGLINVITKKPDNAPTLTADVFSSTWAEVNADLGLKFKVNDKVQSLLGVNYFNYKNPIDNNNDGFTDLTLQDRISIFNKWTFQRKDNRIFSLAGRYVYEDRWGGQMNWNAEEHRGGEEVYGESIYTKRWEVFGVYQLPTKEIINLQFSANGHDQNSIYGANIYLAQQYIGFGQVTWNKTLGRNNLLLGLAYRYNFYDDQTTATESTDKSNDPAITHLPGVFLQNELKFNAKNTLLLGLRYDYNSLHGNIFSPRLNYKWNSKSKKTILRLSAGNGFRVVNIFTEDHAALSGAREVVFEDELQPEMSWNGNINFVQELFSQSGNYINLDASIFYTYFSNAILPDYDTNPRQIIYGNLDGSAVSQGIALNADMAFTNGLNVIVGATLMDVSVTQNGEKIRQPLTEEFTTTWTIGYTFGQSGFKFDYTGNLYSPMRLPLLGERDTRPANSPWFSLQNIQLTKTFKNGLEVYGGIKNLLNYTPPANSISRPFDPFDRNVDENDPNALTFDPTYVFAPNQGIRGFLGLRYSLR